jgi:hypothetical protein
MPAGRTAQVVSVSRRTDIPALYTEWFMNRIREGYAQYQNPFGGQMYEVSLKPDNVMAFVFWSRNYGPLLPYLTQLDQHGYGSYFHFTITGFGPPLEPHAPSLQHAIDTFKSLADRYSPQHVLWRFDPLVLSSVSSAEYLLEQFNTLAGQLSGYTERCYISFVDFYHKTKRNLQQLTAQGVHCEEWKLGQQLALTRQLVDLGNRHHIQLHACCESELLEIPGVTQAHCVDGLLLHTLFPEKFHSLKRAPTRKGCGCFASRDIGAYDTCIYGCAYCYANASHQKALERYKGHDPEQPAL